MSPRLRRALSQLRKKLPLSHPVVVKLEQIPAKDNAVGIISFERGRFRIVLDPDELDDRGLMESLAHEWAHAMVWDVPEPARRHHSEIWGVAYARCYCAAFEVQ